VQEQLLFAIGGICVHGEISITTRPASASRLALTARPKKIAVGSIVARDGARPAEGFGYDRRQGQSAIETLQSS
jgi:hypothetical protein